MSGLRSIIGGLEPVSLEELDRRAPLPHRTDTKFVLSRDELAWVLVDSGYAVLEIAGNRVFAYENVYFDTPDLRCFDDLVEDRVPRFKVRTRCYRNTGHCTLEVKRTTRFGRTVTEQVDHSPQAADRLDDRAIAWIADALGDDAPDDLLPSLRTRFDRVTVLPPQGKERVTCDFNLMMERPDGGIAFLEEGVILFEVRAPGADGVANEHIVRSGIEPISMGRYRTGIALLASEAHDPASPNEAERQFAAHLTV